LSHSPSSPLLCWLCLSNNTLDVFLEEADERAVLLDPIVVLDLFDDKRSRKRRSWRLTLDGAMLEALAYSSHG